MIINTNQGGVVPDQIIDAATITPGVTDQVLAAATYLRGAQTILGDPDLIAENIKGGVNIFGIDGTFGEFGIIINKTDENNNPTDVTIKFPCDVVFGADMGSNRPQFNYLSRYCKILTIDAPNLSNYAFNACFGYFEGKLKIKNTVTWGQKSFGGIATYGSSLAEEDKKRAIFIPITTTYMGTNYCPFYGAATAQIRLYCEATSKPSGWNSTYWNQYNYTVTWGVTEEQFDAL